MLTKDFQDKVRRIKSLINKDEGTDVPLSEKILDELFQNIDPADFYIAKREYLLNLGTPDDAFGDNIIIGLILAVNIEDWAPALFRLLGAEKKRRRRDKKRIIALDSLYEDFDKIFVKFPSDNPKDWPSPIDPPVDNKTALEIENRALISKKIRRLILTSPNKNVVNILKIIDFEDPFPPQDEIATKLGITQGSVSKTIQKIRKCFSS